MAGSDFTINMWLLWRNFTKPILGCVKWSTSCTSRTDLTGVRCAPVNTTNLSYWWLVNAREVRLHGNSSKLYGPAIRKDSECPFGILIVSVSYKCVVQFVLNAVPCVSVGCLCFLLFLINQSQDLRQIENRRSFELQPVYIRKLCIQSIQFGSAMMSGCFANSGEKNLRCVILDESLFTQVQPITLVLEDLLYQSSERNRWWIFSSSSLIGCSSVKPLLLVNRESHWCLLLWAVGYAVFSRVISISFHFSNLITHDLHEEKILDH